jgi:peptidoglycan endopeptidase LytF/peptidoglycan endopeptidase LytE
MTGQIRFLLLVVALAYSTIFGPGHAVAGFKPGHRLAKLKPHRPRLHRPHVSRLRVPEALGVRAVRYASRFLGIPYRYGGDSPGGGFDCSGLVRYVYAHFGFSLPHSSYADFDLGRQVTRGSLRPGDLVFFDGVGHVGMYVGDGRFIHAPHTGTRVQVTSLSDPWYRATYDGARRVLPLPRTPRQILRSARVRAPRLRLF